MNASTKQAYQDKMEAQLTQWGAEIGKLRAKADQASAEAKIEGYRQLEQLKAKQEQARKRLEELKTSGSEKLDELKTGIEDSWQQLKAALDLAIAKIGKH